AMKFTDPRDSDLVLCFRDDGAGHCEAAASIGADEMIALPQRSDFHTADALIYLFSIDGRSYFLIDGDADRPSERSFLPIRELIARKDDYHAFAIATGMHLWRWYRDNRFCGCCGAPLEPSTHERALVCPACEHVTYPRISPAVIVAVTNGDHLLLTRYAQGGYRKLALVAGFVEVGETPEQAVAREVKEECGLQVKNVRYYASQPWGLSGSLMLGFVAELDGDPTITLQDCELAWAGWIARNEIDAPEGYALGHAMIEAFKNGALI
ncbi:MAG: NAD(+) diphosphatase, partial [Eggerthellaceae bacterium]|nr:NAD(+) diphosphatase [Eggerthellaceae bacterium]